MQLARSLADAELQSDRLVQAQRGETGARQLCASTSPRLLHAPTGELQNFHRNRQINLHLHCADYTKNHAMAQDVPTLLMRSPSAFEITSPATCRVTDTSVRDLI